MECIEDYGVEEREKFNCFDDAIKYLKEKNADLSLMKSLKGNTFI